ncbi:tRNA-dependent cyclodipeptide synthase, partial [Streptomyces sp. NPDC003233]
MTTASVLMADVFEVQPYTSHCEVILGEGAHAVTGVSPGNSYFSARRLRDLARWGLDHFDRVDFVYTDLFVAEMYEASGYPPDEARRKAVNNLRGVRAKVRDAVSAADPEGLRMDWHPMSEFRTNPGYQDIHRQLQARLASRRRPSVRRPRPDAAGRGRREIHRRAGGGLWGSALGLVSGGLDRPEGGRRSA